MHPVPLLGVPEDQPFERRVERARRETNRLVRAFVLDEPYRLLEAEHVAPVRLAPRGRRQDRGAGRERDDREALERTRWMAEEFDVDAVRAMRVLIERKHNHIAGFETLDDSIERAALAHDAK